MNSAITCPHSVHGFPTICAFSKSKTGRLSFPISFPKDLSDNPEKMSLKSIITSHRSVDGLPPIHKFSKSKMGRDNFLKEISDRLFLSTHQNSLQFPVPSRSANGNTRPRPALRNSNGLRAPNADSNNPPQSSKSKKGNYKAILDILRRMRSSIPKENSTGHQKRTSDSSLDKQSKSSSEFLPETLKQVKEKASNGDGGKVSLRRKGESNKEEIVDFPPTTAEAKKTMPPSNFVEVLLKGKGELKKEEIVDFPSTAEVRRTRPPSNFVDVLQRRKGELKKEETVFSSTTEVKMTRPPSNFVDVVLRRKGKLKKEEIADFPSTAEVKVTRPPSNFVKRSPIPSRRIVRVEDEIKDTGEELEKLKLSALKELAKSKGIKGYSKLKKGELVELLKMS